MKKGILSVVLATFFFSTMEIALKLSSGSFNAVQFTFLWFLIGGLVLLPPAVLAKKERKQGETLGAETGAGGAPGGAER